LELGLSLAANSSDGLTVRPADFRDLEVDLNLTHTTMGELQNHW